MILNLTKGFRFNRDSKEYSVDYLFTKPENVPANGNIYLTLSISVDNTAAKKHQLTKPTAVLYQSNEIIEKMIEDEVVSFSR